MTKPSFRERLAYAFDRSLSRGPLVLILWLAGLSLAVIVGLSALVWITGIAPAEEGGGHLGFIQIAWMSLMRTLDSGTMGGDTGSWWFLLSMLGVTLGGIFVIGSFIGALTSAIEEKMAELRKGRSRVLESGHTLILGWSPRVFSIVSELTIANANQKRAAVVVLGNRDKVEMEEALRERVGETGPTRVVCRSGDPSDMADLEMVNVQGSKSIVLLPSPGADADTDTIKGLLAITNSPTRREAPYHVVTEIRDPKNLAVAKLVGREEAKLVLVPELLARITVQTCRQAGLSVVYQELLDFGGDEIYFHPVPELAGRTFGDILGQFEESSVLGLRRGDGRIVLNPPMDTAIAGDDKVIAISEDDDTIRVADAVAPFDAAAIAPVAPRPAPLPERTLILGWSDNAPRILHELDQYVAEGSLVTVVAAMPEGVDAVSAQCPVTQRLEIALQAGEPTDRATLDALDVPSYDHVILLSPEIADGSEGGAAEQRADGRTLVTLLHLRDIREQQETGGRRFSIVSEMLDVRNRALAEITRADDFIVGDQLVSLLMTQVSENAELFAVFEDLFDPEGSEIYLKPATDYVQPGREVNVATLVESARRRGEIAIGYRLLREARDKEKAYGVATNPPKSRRVTFAAGDSVIVLAES